MKWQIRRLDKGKGEAKRKLDKGKLEDEEA